MSRRSLVEAAVAVALVSTVATLLIRELGDIDVGAVLTAVKQVDRLQIVRAAVAVAGAYAALITYDLLAVWQAGLAVSPRKTALTSFVSYAFNFSFGSLVGAVAMRLRLYGRFGVDRADVGGIMLFCIVTTWIGYSVLAGALFLATPPVLPERWHFPASALQPLGVFGVALAATYVTLCRIKRGPLQIHRWTLRLPRARMALAQIGIGGTYWALSALALYQLLPHGGPIDYARVLSIYLIAAVAAVAARIPGGLGVLEGTFVLFLAPLLAKPTVLAALLAFRGLFYLAPLLVAALVYAGMEIYGRRRATRDDKDQEQLSASKAAFTLGS